MSPEEIISKAEEFAITFIGMLESKVERLERKQVFFIENQEALKGYMEAVSNTITSIKESTDDNPTGDAAVLVQRAEQVIKQFKHAIEGFQKELTIDSNIEDTPIALTEETITKAMKEDKTTQEISEKMGVIVEQAKNSNDCTGVLESPKEPCYNYALCCDGSITFISADTKGELNLRINNIVDRENCKDVHLFRIDYTPIQLKRKIVLSV